MGAVYWLLKPEKKEMFELGKGSWILVFSSGQTYKTATELYFTLLKKIALDFDESVKLKYFKDLANHIFRWIGNDEVDLVEQEEFFEKYGVSTGEWEQQWKITGSRYSNNRPVRGMMLNPSLFTTIWYFEEDGELVPFTPLIRTYDIKLQKWLWVGFRLDKSDCPKDFVVDICRSIDKRDLTKYKVYPFNDILVEVPIDQTIKEVFDGSF